MGTGRILNKVVSPKWWGWAWAHMGQITEICVSDESTEPTLAADIYRQLQKRRAGILLTWPQLYCTITQKVISTERFNEYENKQHCLCLNGVANIFHSLLLLCHVYTQDTVRIHFWVTVPEACNALWKSQSKKSPAWPWVHQYTTVYHWRLLYLHSCQISTFSHGH